MSKRTFDYRNDMCRSAFENVESVKSKSGGIVVRPCIKINEYTTRIHREK